jgi:alkylation response protein AidB-like acyl-CoA dehydrogenase
MNKTLDELFFYPLDTVDEEAQDVLHLVRQWADREILSKRQEYRENIDPLFIEKRNTLNLTIGLQRLTLPEEHGGFGWDHPSRAPGIVSVLSEIGRADASIGVISAMQCAIFAVAGMPLYSDAELSNMLASAYCVEELRTSSVILPGTGSADKETSLFLGRSIAATVKTDGDGFTLNGFNMRPFSSGSCADLFCVVCADQEGRPCIALVPGNDRNILRGRTLQETGLNSCANAEVSFNGVHIPKSHVLIREGVVEEIYAWLNLFLGSVSVGVGMNSFEIFRDWAETRTIKGGTMMKENPLCASVLADVADEIFTARLLLYNLAHMMSKPEDWKHGGFQRIYTFSQIIGSQIQQKIVRAINRGLELMGSAGYAKEWHVEKHWRDAKTIQSYLCGVGAEAPVKMDTARFFFDCKEM